MHADLLCSGCRAYTASSGGSRGGSMELPFCMKGCLCVLVCLVSLCKRNCVHPHWRYTEATLKLHSSNNAHVFPPASRGCFAKRSHAYKLCAAGHPTLAVSPQNGTRNDRRRSELKKFHGGGGHQVHTGIPLFKILDPPLASYMEMQP